jgi:hypothetical protein
LGSGRAFPAAQCAPCHWLGARGMLCGRVSVHSRRCGLACMRPASAHLCTDRQGDWRQRSEAKARADGGGRRPAPFAPEGLQCSLLRWPRPHSWPAHRHAVVAGADEAVLSAISSESGDGGDGGGGSAARARTRDTCHDGEESQAGGAQAGTLCGEANQGKVLCASLF